LELSLLDFVLSADVFGALFEIQINFVKNFCKTLSFGFFFGNRCRAVSVNFFIQFVGYVFSG